VLVLGFAYANAKAQMSALDPVRVAPHIYESLLDNERVRVLKMTERTGETPPLHSHPDRVVVFLSPCAWMETGSRVVQECSLLEIELK
jgi:hypothetical protein